MSVMYETLSPFGYINYRCIKGITKTTRYYYIIDDVYNYLRISEKTFNQLLEDGFIFIRSHRKGV